MLLKSFSGWRMYASTVIFCAFGFFAFITLGGQHTALAQSVYENQSPMTEKELTTFIQLLPQFRAWASAQKEVAHPSITQGKADFVYSSAAATWVKNRQWEPRRFFAVMGKAAAALYLLSEGGNDKARPQDMPKVSQAELNLVQRHLSALLEAGKRTAPPMAQ